MNWCIIIPLLVGLISALLGYLLGRLLGAGKNNNEEYNSKIAKLKADLEACNSAKLSLQSDLETEKTNAANLVSSFAATNAIVFNADAAKAVFGKKIKENDLTVVEGIGPKIQELFHKNGVTTWKALSECSVEKCQEVLDNGGDNYKIHNPKTWPKQAKMAYEGLWQELLNWQDELDGGK